MIRYDLNCDNDHSFDAWFRDSEAFDKLAASGAVSCAICGSSRVTKAIMAPAVGPSSKAREDAPLSKPRSPAETALAELREKLENSSDYVGRDFAAEARKIHDGEADARSIWGEARFEDAKALHEDGIPVAPLPWISRRDD